MFDLPQDAILYTSDARGVYIPQHFAESIKRDCVEGVSAEDWAILESGPDHEHYWDAWNDVEQTAIVMDQTGKRFTLYQDGDLWLIPEGFSFEEESE